MDDRRELAFERIGDVMPEVERLLIGHSTTKGWTLGQILHHLSISVRLSITPGDDAPDSARLARLERAFEFRRRRFFGSGRFPEGVEPPHRDLHPPLEADERSEAESLRAALGMLGASEGPFTVHPMLGPLSKDEWVDFHRIHCAHHLGFAKVTRPG
jgi:hypothetical protein